LKNQTRNYIKEDEDAVVKLQEKFKEKHPEYWIRSGTVYSEHPAFEQGKNILCGFNEEGDLVAYAPIFPTLAADKEGAPHHFWMDILYNPFDPGYPEIKDQLFRGVIERANVLKAQYDGHPCILTTLQMMHHQDSMAFYDSKGFRETTRLLTMRKKLKETLPVRKNGGNYIVRPYKLDDQAMIENYLRADRAANPTNPLSREKLLWNLDNPWKGGKGYGIFDYSGNLVASVMTYSLEKGVYMTEEIFVTPPHQGKGLGELLLIEVLHALSEQGVFKAELEVKNDNTPAKKLYQKLGYITVKEECTLELQLGMDEIPLTKLFTVKLSGS